jgi:hypothetical protein
VRHLSERMSVKAHGFAKRMLAKLPGAVIAIAVIFSFAALSSVSAYAGEEGDAAQSETKQHSESLTTTSGNTPSPDEVSNSDNTAAKENPSSDETDAIDSDGTTVLGTLKILATGTDENNASQSLQGVTYVVRLKDKGYLAEGSNGAWQYVSGMDDAKRFVTDTNGVIEISGLESGEYTVEEVATPEGFDENDVKTQTTVLSSSSSTVTPGDGTDESSEYDPVYVGKNYSPEAILSEFQLFTPGVLTNGTHIVGAIAVGEHIEGTVNGGQGSVTKSYVKNLQGDVITGGWGNCSFVIEGGYTDYRDCPFTSVYYENATDGFQPETFMNGEKSKYEKVSSENTIDFAKAIETVAEASGSMAAGEQSYVVSASDYIDDDSNGVHVVNVDLDEALQHPVQTGTDSKGNKVEEIRILVPADQWTDRNGIRFTSETLTEKEIIGLFGSAGLGDGGTIKKIVVSIEGQRANLDFSVAHGNNPGVAIMGKDTQDRNNGTKLGDKLKNYVTQEGNADSQFYGKGTKLIWNFPDATSVSVKEYVGHVVAPNATLTAGGGEGNLIAANITVANEIHFYSYGHIPTKPRKVEKVSSAAVSFAYVKSKKEEQLGKVTWAKVDSADNGIKLSGSEWKLHFVSAADGNPTSDYTVVDAASDGDITNCQTAAENDALLLCDTNANPGEIAIANLKQGGYTLTETKAPEGYLFDATKTWTFTIGENSLEVDLGEITNDKKTYSAPSTGRIGGIPVYIASGFATLLIGACLTTRIRKEW